MQRENRIGAGQSPRTRPNARPNANPGPPMSLRDLPSVDVVLATPVAQALLGQTPRELLTDAIRHAIAGKRREIQNNLEAGVPSPPVSTDEIALRAKGWLQKNLDPDIPSVVNATGILLHTNLGRAPLAPRAIESLLRAARTTSALEFDLETGQRGHRDNHISTLLADLTGAEAGMAVNNNAAALLLTIDSLAARREVIVSRGELIEIGGAFRLPDMLRRAGAVLREVGTTNRTRLADYEEILSRRTGLLLRAHPSNYRIEGFTEAPSRSQLAELAHKHQIPFVEDLGSGSLVDLAHHGAAAEPRVSDAVKAGVDLVTFSGDKLLGGPQAGLIVGRADLITKLQNNPFKRALRMDKLGIAALRATLSLYRTSTNPAADIPILGWLTRSPDELDTMARQSLDLMSQVLPADFVLEILESEAEIGSGAQPTVKLPSRAISVQRKDWSPEKMARFFRMARPAILGRIGRGRFLLDLGAVQSASDLVPRGDQESAA